MSVPSVMRSVIQGRDEVDAAKADGRWYRALIDSLDGVADRFLPVVRDRPLSGIRAPPRSGAVHAEERDQVRAGVRE